MDISNHNILRTWSGVLILRLEFKGSEQDWQKDYNPGLQKINFYPLRYLLFSITWETVPGGKGVQETWLIFSLLRAEECPFQCAGRQASTAEGQHGGTPNACLHSKKITCDLGWKQQHKGIVYTCRNRARKAKGQLKLRSTGENKKIRRQQKDR